MTGLHKNRWIVRWQHNGCEHWEPFEFRYFAEMKMIQLEAFNIKCELIDLFTQPQLVELFNVEGLGVN